MSLPRTRSTKEKTIAPENASKPRWKSLLAHGADLGEIYGHSVVYHAPSESLYLFGGSSRTGTFHNNVMRFNLRIQRWDVVTTTGKRPKGRHFHSAVLLDHNMYIFGGKCNGYMNDISCLNLVSMEWLDLEVGGTVPSRRYGHSMVIHNRSFYVYGGYDDFGYKCNDMYEFRPTSNKWSKVTTSGQAPERYHHSAVAHSGSMYLFGGSCTDMSLASALFEYRFGTATWTRIPTHQKSPESRWGHSSFIHDNELYILGGCDNILCFKDVYRISLDSLAWKRVKKISGFDPRYFGGCVLLHSNWAKCEYSAPSDNENAEGAQTSSTANASSSADPSSSEPSDRNSTAAATVLHHSHAVTAAYAAPRGATAPHNGTVAVPSIATPTANTASRPSSSSTSPASGVSSPPLPTVTVNSPLPSTESIGLGFKVIYIGGRNIHNWAFSDILALSLEGEDAYDPFPTQMQSLVGNTQHSDVTFVFPNEQSTTIPAHRAILAIRCEPFGKMFSMGLAESTSGIIEITDVPSHLFRVFLSFLYIGTLPALDALQDNLHMLYLSDKYFLPHLKSICESRLKTFISSSTLPTMWESATATHASSLQRACVRFVTRYSDVLMTSAGKKSLPKSLIVEAKAKLQQQLATSSS